MTRQKCRQICTNGYFVYFGLQWDSIVGRNGTNCYCGNSINEPTYVSMLECTKPCSGNPLEFCGGVLKMNILKTQTKCEKEREKARASGGALGGYVPQCWTLEEWEHYKNDSNIDLDVNGVNVGAYKWEQTWASTDTSWCVDLDGNRLNTTDTKTVDFCSPFYTGQCINDPISDRRLNGAYFSDDYLSRRKCLDACKSAFYRYAGVENGRDCYCGNKLEPYYSNPNWGVGTKENARIIPDIECDAPCSGDLSEKCGGEFFTMNIFNIQSKCEKQRDDVLENKRTNPDWVGYFLPVCTESGEFQPSQFDASSGHSWCVDMNGAKVPGTETSPGQEPIACYPHYTGQCISNQNQTLTFNSSDDSMTRHQCDNICYRGNYSYYGLANGHDCYCGNTVEENLKYLPFVTCNARCGGEIHETCGGVDAFNLFSINYYD